METSVQRIVDLCADKGISRVKLCRDIGIPPTTFSNYVIRGGKPSYDMLKKISSYLGVSIEYLVSGNEPEINIEIETAELVSRISALSPEKQRKVLSLMYNLIASFE